MNDIIAHEKKRDLKFLRRYFLYSQTTAGGHQRILWTPEPGNRLELLRCRGWGPNQVRSLQFFFNYQTSDLYLYFYLNYELSRSGETIPDICHF